MKTNTLNYVKEHIEWHETGFVLALTQGSSEWHEHRARHWNASEAGIVLGLSKHTSRNELIKLKATGEKKAFSQYVQTKILDHGHKVEALAREILEQRIGENLYPVTCVKGKFSASCDGLTIDKKIAFECKQWNQSYAEMVQNNEVPSEHMSQCQQVLLCAGADFLYFVISDGTPEKFVMTKVAPDDAWRDKLLYAWKQFDADVAAYKHAPEVVKPIVKSIDDLPSILVQVNGALTVTDNLSVFGERLQLFVSAINMKPQDDEDFANTEAAIKTLIKAEDALNVAEAEALSQVACIDDIRKLKGMYYDLARTTRLTLEKLVKSEKENRKQEIIAKAKKVIVDYKAHCNSVLGGDYLPVFSDDFTNAMKNKRTIEALLNSADSEVARIKIEINGMAATIQANIETLAIQAKEFEFLFVDIGPFFQKQPDDFLAFVQSRIANYLSSQASKKELLKDEQTSKKELLKIDAESTTKDHATVDEANIINNGCNSLRQFKETYGAYKEFEKIINAIDIYFKEKS